MNRKINSRVFLLLPFLNARPAEVVFLENSFWKESHALEVLVSKE